MKKIKTVLLVTLISAFSLTAQNHFKPDLAVLKTPSEVKVKSGLDSLNILAIMVQFQPDLYDATVGNGRLGSVYSEQTASRTDIIDPLPHDKTYFENHLEFVKNYYEKNSAGKLNVNYTVADNIVTLDYTMRNYSPEPGSDDFSGLINLAVEAWQKFSAQNPNFDFSAYNMFVIFHAGVGRDVSLPGSIGLERDIPSVYLSLNSMKYYLGDTFTGIDVGNNFKITNSAILPETESREAATIVGTELYQLTINGLAVSMVGSRLGLPDLYNTETGYSAIGRFGLMDGQSIFAYAGAFPPAPSPIEKMWLGWIEPKEVYLKNGKIDLTTYMKLQAGDTALVKIPINSTEYFLVENRERDANSNGAVITYKLGNRVHTIVMAQDTTGFNNFNIDTLRGVITDIDESDWALPGNGIVIWHIDENVINEKRASNTINNDKTHKGVAVVEADGIFDIGEIFTTIFGDKYVGEGEQNDFWFKENKGHYFTDAFTPESKPSSNSYSRANSGIYITDFSSISNKMSFNLNFNFNEFQLEKVFTLPQHQSIDFINSSQSDTLKYFTVKSEKNIYVYDKKGELKYTLPNFSESPNLILTFHKTYVIGNVGNKINIFSFDNNSAVRDSFIVPGEITSPLSARYVSITEFRFGVATGNSYRLYSFKNDYNTGVWDSSSVAVTDKIIQVIFTPQVELTISKKKITNLLGESYTSENEIVQAAFADITTPSDYDRKIILLEKNNSVEVVDYSSFEQFSFFTIDSPNQVENFSLVSANKFTYPYINFSIDGKNYFYNLKGFLSDSSPLEDDEGIGFSGMCAGFSDNSNNGFFINFTSDGRLFSFNQKDMSSRLSPFFTVGNELKQTPVIFTDNDTTMLVMANKSNDIYLFGYPVRADLYFPFWSGKFANGANNMTLQVLHYPSESNGNYQLLNAYNWPNPVYGGTTNFRFKVNENSNVKILIFDMAGTKVAELSGYGDADFDNEIPWDVSNVQSDVYFAHFEATGINSHQTETKLIKVVVIK